MARRTSQQADETRCQLLDAAEALFFEQGVARTTLEQVARRAGLTRGAIYHHFCDKVEIFEAVVDRGQLPHEEIRDRLLAEAESGRPLESLEEACISSIRQIAADDRRRRIYVILMHRCEYVEEMETARNRERQSDKMMRMTVVQCLERAHVDRTLAPQWTPETAARAIKAFMSGLMAEWLLDPEAFPIDNVETCVRAFFRSLHL